MAAKLILVANLRLGLAPPVNGLDIPAAHQILLYYPLPSSKETDPP